MRQENATMQKCPFCGQESKGHTRCPVCATRLTPPGAPKSCPLCGSLFDGPGKICLACARGMG